MIMLRQISIAAIAAAQLVASSPVNFDPRATGTCLDGTASEADINLALYYGGEGTVVSLCPGASIPIKSTIVFTAPNQEISTAGYPSGSLRATLVVLGSDQSVAIYMGCGSQCAGVAIKNIQVNGNRPALGRLESGAALIEAGGDSGNQIVDNCHIFEPRGWSALHIGEGYQNSCKNVAITNNQIGPSGNSPNQGAQFVAIMKGIRNFLGLPVKVPQVKVQSGSFTPGQWADGISLSCAQSTVTGNVVTDATDGGIVIFGSPGSTIAHNTIQSVNRNLLGGINLVDFAPWGGDFSGVEVFGNTIYAKSAMIKIGVALGIMSWGSYNHSEYYTSGGSVHDNTFMATGTNNGYFGYTITVAGHYNANVGANDLSQNVNGGSLTDACIGEPYAPPSPRPYVYDPYTSSGTLATGFEPDTLVFLICNGPSSSDDPGVPYPYPDNAANYATQSIESISRSSLAPDAVGSSTLPVVSSTPAVVPAPVVPTTTPAVVAAPVPTTTPAAVVPQVVASVTSVAAVATVVAPFRQAATSKVPVTVRKTVVATVTSQVTSLTKTTVRKNGRNVVSTVTKIKPVTKRVTSTQVSIARRSAAEDVPAPQPSATSSPPVLDVPDYSRDNIFAVSTPKVTFSFHPSQVGRKG